MEQEIDAGRTELGDSGREQLSDSTLKAWNKWGISVSSRLVLGKRHRGGLGAELRGCALISGCCELDLRNVSEIKCKKAFAFRDGR